jgi:proline iminopeptidase
LPNEEIEYIYYDQLIPYCDKPNDSALWTTEHFVEEVEQVRKALNLNKDNFTCSVNLGVECWPWNTP